MLDPLDMFEEEDGPFEGGSTDDAAEIEEAVSGMGRETLLAFMGSLFFAHVGLFAASIGLLLVYFRGQWVIGGVAVVGGIAALVLTGIIYRWYDGTR